MTTTIEVNILDLMAAEVERMAPNFAPKGVTLLPNSLQFPAGSSLSFTGGPRNSHGNADKRGVDVSGMIPGSTHVFFVPANFGTGTIKVIVTDGSVVRSFVMERAWTVKGVAIVELHLPDECWQYTGKPLTATGA